MKPTVLLVGFVLMSAASEGQQAAASLSPQPLARDVMYRIVFREIAAYESQADALRSQSKPDLFLRKYHEDVLQLTPQQAQEVRQIALPCVQAIDAIDQEARAIIQASKSKHKGAPRGSADAMVPPPPPELTTLEARRKATVLAAADTIAAALGPSQFAYFEMLVRRHVGSSYKASVATAKVQ